MGQQTINDNETGLSVRNKLNANFTELYTGKDSVTVNAFADLPDPTTVPQQKYWVLTSTGVYLVNRRNAGAYYSDGAVWTWLGNNPTTADQIGNVPAGGIAATNVQSALNELDTDKEVAGTAAAAIVTHVGLADPHTQYALESSLGTLATQNGTFSGTSSGTNTGDQTTISGNAGSATVLQTGRAIAMTGDLTWNSGSFNGSANVTAAGTLATVNGNVGTFGSDSLIPVVTVNAKGLITGISTVAAAGGAGAFNIGKTLAISGNQFLN